MFQYSLHSVSFFKALDQTDMKTLRKKSLKLTGYLEMMIKEYFSKDVNGDSKPFIDIFTPSDPEQRGCQLSLCFSIPIKEIYRQLTMRGIVASGAFQRPLPWSDRAFLSVDKWS